MSKRRRSHRPSLLNSPLSTIETAAHEHHAAPRRSIAATAIYRLLNPVPFGFFVAGLIFDIVYARTAVILWDKADAWLILIGLLFAIVPRIINLVQVWITLRALITRAERIDFWLNLVAIIAAIFNAFVHSRDAYGVAPTGLWLSALTVILLAIGHIIVAVQYPASGELIHE